MVMTDTPNLGLPFIEASQAQKHVTHNEALRILDAAIQVAVLDISRTTPPAGPADGERHVVAVGATGAWAGRAQAIATWQDGAWAYLAPNPGWCVWSVADDALLVFDGGGWRNVGLPALDSVAHLGINASADAGNLLSVKSNAALFAAIHAADGGSGDVRLQLSKEAAAKVASVVFSTHYSGRAEFGLVGSDAFKLKVSPDGASFAEALVVDQATGNVALPRGLALTGVVAPAPITANQNDFAPAGLAMAAVLQIASDTPRSISGLVSGAEGRVVSVLNVGGQPITLLDESTASGAANRFALGGHLVLAGKQATMLRYDGTAARWQAIAGTPAVRAPTVQSFLSGSGTYTTPPGVKWIEVLAVGGGGGSAGSGTSAGNGTNGGDTTFGGSLIVAGGGSAPPAAGFSGGGAGGVASLGAGAIGLAVTGGGGNPSNSFGPSVYPFGGAGGSSLLGGAGPGASANSPGGSGATNTGGGGGGPSANVGQVSGASGGAGASARGIVSTPLPEYSYAVGIGGSGGSPGASGNAGSPGGSGGIFVVEHY
jgi:Protein of unknown function (DUF2793)